MIKQSGKPAFSCHLSPFFFFSYLNTLSIAAGIMARLFASICPSFGFPQWEGRRGEATPPEALDYLSQSFHSPSLLSALPASASSIFPARSPRPSRHEAPPPKAPSRSFSRHHLLLPPHPPPAEFRSGQSGTPERAGRPAPSLSTFSPSLIPTTIPVEGSCGMPGIKLKCERRDRYPLYVLLLWSLCGPSLLKAIYRVC